ncbi:MAG: triose-phosphate isomerase [Chitinophagales bacterium]
MRKQIAAANWKMNLTYQQAEQLLDEVLNAEISMEGRHLAIFAVPFPYLIMTKSELADNKNYYAAAQNCYYKKSGAFTGEVSAEMLRSIGIQYCVLGHSERREYFSETNQELAEKINLCLSNQITPIFCCGEPLSIREHEGQNAYVEKQLNESLFHLSGEQLLGIVIAYEPIWAIGTGRTASTQQAQEMHANLRKVLANQYSEEIASSVSILYGGSVKANNAAEIFGAPDVDGGLVGGASLVSADYIQIMRSLK